MADSNPSFVFVKRADYVREKLRQLEELRQSHANEKRWETYDTEVENLLAQTFARRIHI